MLRHYNTVFDQVRRDLGNDITYNDQIEKYCRKTDIAKHNFLGVFPQDVSPEMIARYPNCCLIINTSKSNEPGEHWIGVWVEGTKAKKGGNRVYYFDSFGRNPEKITPLFNKGLGGNIIYDDDKNQRDCENNCGQRAISWLLCCCKYGVANAIKI